MIDYLTKEEIKHPSFHCYCWNNLFLSQFEKPIFTLQKCERSFVIINKIYILNVITAFNCLFYREIKERDDLDAIDERIRKEITDLAFCDKFADRVLTAYTITRSVERKTLKQYLQNKFICNFMTR
jgi:hypothetical protein